MHNNLWTQEECDIIVNNPDLSLARMKQLLPNRTSNTISHKRSQLCRSLRTDGTTYEQPVWTEDELELLRLNKDKSIEVLCDILPTHSYFGIFRKLNENEALRKANDRAKALAAEQAAKWEQKAAAEAAKAQAKIAAERAKSRSIRSSNNRRIERRYCSQFFLWLDQRAAI